jgi:methylated-DNA-protein-cysteine methyltransferase-like protein
MSFFDQVYELVRMIPEGKVATYGEIARALGTRDSRRVGHALHANPSGAKTPCHRVVTKDGKLSESYAFGGSMEQYAKLLEEGVAFIDKTHVNLAKHIWHF